MLLSGAWGKVIHEKNLKQKISWHCPFKSFPPFNTVRYVNSWSHGKPSALTLSQPQVFIQHLILQNFSPCRTKAQHNKPTKVYGALIGKQAGRDIEICNSFELDYLTTDVGQVRRFSFY
jgi:hypothetical protein